MALRSPRRSRPALTRAQGAPSRRQGRRSEPPAPASGSQCRPGRRRRSRQARGHPVRDLRQTELRCSRTACRRRSRRLRRVLAAPAAPAPAGTCAACRRSGACGERDPLCSDARSAGDRARLRSPDARKRAGWRWQRRRTMWAQGRRRPHFIGIFGVDLSLQPVCAIHPQHARPAAALDRMATRAASASTAPRRARRRRVSNRRRRSAAQAAAAAEASGRRRRAVRSARAPAGPCWHRCRRT